MPDIDAITREYLEDDATFADAFNFFMFGGREVIKCEDLKPVDPNELTILEEGDDKTQSIQKYRDLLKNAVIRQDGKVAYMLLGIENQANIHYAMPVRCMLYDAMRYDKQIRAIAKKHEASEPTADSAEFLSGFHKNDKLLPVFTLTIFWGPETWDGPKDLHSMLDLKPELLSWFDNYHLRLIEPSKIEDEDFARFKTELGKGLICAKYAKNMRKLREVVQKDEAFRKLKQRTARLIRAVTKRKILTPVNQETVNMIEELDEYEEELILKGREEGIGIGVEKGREEGIGIGREEGIMSSLSNLMQTTKWGIERSMEALGIPLDQREKYAALLSHPNV